MPSRPHQGPHNLSDGGPAGTYLARDIRPGQPYELSNGHKIRCMSQSGRSSQDEAGGVSTILSDPAGRDTGVDTGYTMGNQRRLRAPDIAVGDIPDEPGWVHDRVPQLAVEYADTGQNEDQLQSKIQEFLSAGTRYIWVVRLVGPRRVEVYEAGQKVRLMTEDDHLLAPGVLQNPVPVAALFDKSVALETTFRNLLNRKGYKDLGAVKAEGKAEGKAQSLLRVLEARGLRPSEAQRQQVLGCQDEAALDRLIDQAVHAATVEEALR